MPSGKATKVPSKRATPYQQSPQSSASAARSGSQDVGTNRTPAENKALTHNLHSEESSSDESTNSTSLRSMSSSLTPLVTSPGDPSGSTAPEKEVFRAEGRYSDRRADLEIRTMDGQVFLVHMFLLAEESSLIQHILATPKGTITADTASQTSTEMPRARIDLPASAASTKRLLDFLTTPRGLRPTPLKVLNARIVEEAYTAIDFLGCDCHIESFKNAVTSLLNPSALLRWACQHDHDPLAIRAALSGLGVTARRHWKTLEDAIAGLASLPPAYATQIIARTAYEHRPSFTWTADKDAVEDFIRLAKKGIDPA